MPYLKEHHHSKLLDLVYWGKIVIFALIILDILPRSFVPYFTAFLAGYVLFARTEDATIFFARSIPFFLAIPFTDEFDQFNAWRIFSILIFLKWALSYKLKGISSFKNLKHIIYNLKPASYLLIALLFLSVLSIIPAQDKLVAIKRAAYFINLSLIGLVIYDLAKNRDYTKRLIKNLSIPVILVTLIGFAQVASTYFLDIYQFMRLWGEGIQCKQFGTQWCNIATWEGNTWFAYYGEQLSLRVFSLFPDSHTFPMYVLMGLPSIFAMSLYKVVEKSKNLKEMIRIRAKLFVLWIPVILLITILSGTRGVWAASIGVVILAVILLFKLPKPQKSIFKYISLYLIAFFMLFAVAYPIFVSPQFLVSKGDWGLLGNRIKSIIDFGETSNSQRLEIWAKSWESIKKHPLIGVGIGNFPVVLGQDIKLAKAGSSAHNLYIHIAAEMGIVAAGLAIWFLWSVFARNFKLFKEYKDSFFSIYYGASLLFIPWVLIYLLTDAALFDERAFLMFATITAIILGTNENGNS